MNRKLSLLLGVTSLLVVASAAQAQLITSAASITGTTSVIDFSALGTSQSPFLATADPNFSVQVGSPVGRDVRMTYVSGISGLYAGYQGWGLQPSGNWNRSSIGVNQYGVVRYSFMDGPVSGVGVFMNYAFHNTDVFIRTLDMLGNVIDEVYLEPGAPVPTQPANGGGFRGFQYNASSIYSFEVGTLDGSNSSPIMTDLTFNASATSSVVPEPSAVVLMAAGLAALGVLARKRRRA